MDLEEEAENPDEEDTASPWKTKSNKTWSVLELTSLSFQARVGYPESMPFQARA